MRAVLEVAFFLAFAGVVVYMLIWTDRNRWQK